MHSQVKSRLLKSCKSRRLCQLINASALHIAICTSFLRLPVLLAVLINSMGFPLDRQFPGREPEQAPISPI